MNGSDKAIIAGLLLTMAFGAIIAAFPNLFSKKDAPEDENFLEKSDRAMEKRGVGVAIFIGAFLAFYKLHYFEKLSRRDPVPELILPQINVTNVGNFIN